MIKGCGIIKLLNREFGGVIMSGIIFLDIDGVLNSNFWKDNHQTEISDGTLIDEEKIKLLASLVKETDSEIILHSGWRFWFDTESWISYVAKKGVKTGTGCIDGAPGHAGIQNHEKCYHPL